MLDQETKRKIDNARDILVGKVPDPKSQVEQITIALIYKFMDDMDKESQELGGKAAFFKGEFEKYTWSRIFDPKLGGFDLITLYSEAITTMNHNENIPQLFRDIFKNAFLPYRDPETLKSFLKEINEFKYDHSEKLGDAFEYLLSVLGSQGDAGQFRTPRHIIDFIVSVVDPKKNESILDPACGTAGFLISSFKHILHENTKERKGDCLTMDERKRLMNSLVGYDISPDMVRLSLVNMYLHGFQTPKIHEYDTLVAAAKAKGAKRAVPLPVSAPFHSSLLAPAAARLKERLASIEVRAPRIPVVNNVDAAVYGEPDRIKDALVRQADHPVRWVECVRAIAGRGVTHVAECGPGKILAPLVRRPQARLVLVAVAAPRPPRRASCSSRRSCRR